jgi:hypothetical protein
MFRNSVMVLISVVLVAAPITFTEADSKLDPTNPKPPVYVPYDPEPTEPLLNPCENDRDCPSDYRCVPLEYGHCYRTFYRRCSSDADCVPTTPENPLSFDDCIPNEIYGICMTDQGELTPPRPCKNNEDCFPSRGSNEIESRHCVFGGDRFGDCGGHICTTDPAGNAECNRLAHRPDSCDLRKRCISDEGILILAMTPTPDPNEDWLESLEKWGKKKRS